MLRAISRTSRSTISLVRHLTKYTKEHEYVKVSGATGTVGISDHAQSQLGDVVYVGLPAPGDKFKKG